MKNITRNKIINNIQRHNFNRILISEDLQNLAVFRLYERYEDESNYKYEICIDDRWQTYTDNSIKKEIYEFWENKNLYLRGQ